MEGRVGVESRIILHASMIDNLTLVLVAPKGFSASYLGQAVAGYESPPKSAFSHFRNLGK